MLPKAWKSPRQPESYRPITLLSAVTKLFGKLVLALLLPHIPPRDDQFGFRSGHSTTLQVARMIHQAAHTLNRKESAVAAFLGVSRAFDCVWHPGLLHKVLKADTPHHVVHEHEGKPDRRLVLRTTSRTISEAGHSAFDWRVQYPAATRSLQEAPRAVSWPRPCTASTPVTSRCSRTPYLRSTQTTSR